MSRRFQFSLAAAYWCVVLVGAITLRHLSERLPWQPARTRFMAETALIATSAGLFLHTLKRYRRERPRFSLTTLLWFVTAIGIWYAAFPSLMATATGPFNKALAPDWIASAARPIKAIGAVLVAIIAVAAIKNRR